MPKNSRYKLILTEPHVEIIDGHLCFTNPDGEPGNAYPLHLAIKLHRSINDTIREHMSCTGDVVPLDKSFKGG